MISKRQSFTSVAAQTEFPLTTLGDLINGKDEIAVFDDGVEVAAADYSVTRDEDGLWTLVFTVAPTAASAIEVRRFTSLSEFDAGTGPQIAGVDDRRLGFIADENGRLISGVSAVTGTLTIDTGLKTGVEAVAAMFAEDPTLAKGHQVTATIPAQVGADIGKFTLKVWKPTGAADVTPIASTAAVNVSWIAHGR